MTLEKTGFGEINIYDLLLLMDNTPEQKLSAKIGSSGQSEVNFITRKVRILTFLSNVWKPVIMKFLEIPV